MRSKVDELQELFKMHMGNNLLNFVIYDDEDSIKVNIKESRKNKKLKYPKNSFLI